MSRLEKVTQLRVLPVRRGDAYLLQSKRGSYLVDGGAPDSLLPEMLADRRVRKLRAAICSSISPERIGGIVEIMEAQYPVTEYWFPESMEAVPEMARRFNGDWDGWLGKLGLSDGGGGNPVACWQEAESLAGDESRRRLEGAAILIGLAVTACFGWSPYKGLSRNSFLYGEKKQTSSGLVSFFEGVLKLLSERTQSYGKDEISSGNSTLRGLAYRPFQCERVEYLALLCARLLNAEAKFMSSRGERNAQAIVQGVTLAAMAAASLAKTKASVRFFRLTGKLEEYFIPRHPFMCLNGVEVSPLLGLSRRITANRMFQATRNLARQSDGLVFQYGDGNCGILFCGDTKMAFLNSGQVLTLDRPTVITAPRQGNCSSDQAYGRIVSKDPNYDVWVRSHYSYARKVSALFKEKQNKFCLNNCVHRTVQEVLLSNFDGRWNRIAGANCSCS
jgi:hypothetical protein